MKTNKLSTLSILTTVLLVIVLYTLRVISLTTDINCNAAPINESNSYGVTNIINHHNKNTRYLIAPVSVYSSLNQPKKVKGSRKYIPVLTYHCIDNIVWGYKPMFVPVKAFDEQMKYLNEQGYTAITFKDLENIDKISKPVIITFDDGYENNYTNAYPILKKYNMKATIFVISSTIEHQKYLKIWQIKEMQNLIDIESHTVSHHYLDKLPKKEIENELVRSKEYLQSLLNTKIDVLAYPYGSFNDKVIKIAKKYYKYAVTTNPGEFCYKHANDYKIKRISIHNDVTLEKFISLLMIK